MKRERCCSSIDFATDKHTGLAPAGKDSGVQFLRFYVTKVHKTGVMSHGCNTGGTRIFPT